MNINKPLKRFGQNYLVDQNIIRKIVSTFDPKEDDTIVEIGPGRGALTEELLKFCNNTTAVEIDTRVIEDLSERFPQLVLIQKDFLKFNFDELKTNNGKIRVIGNIPYNITSPIIFKLFEEKEKVSDALLMVQHEVAQRFIANKNTKDYGILSVLLNAFGSVKYCFKISPNVFYPKPKVHSAIIKIEFDKTFPEDIEAQKFIKVVKAAFGNRRKTLKNSFKNSIFATHDLSEVEPYLTQRAEQLSIEDYFFITRKLK